MTLVGLWLGLVVHRTAPKLLKLIWILVALPGLLTLLMAFPGMLGVMFWLEQQGSERPIEVLPQPDGPWTARVLLTDDGYIGGGDHLELTVRHAWLPFVERTLSRGEAALDPDSGLGRPYTSWLPGGRVNLNGVRHGSGKFEPSGIDWHAPICIAWPAAAVGFLLDD